MNKVLCLIVPLVLVTSLSASSVKVAEDNMGDYALVNVKKLNKDYSKLLKRIMVLESMVFKKKNIKPEKKVLKLLDESSANIVEGDEIIKIKRKAHVLDPKTVNILNKIK